MSARTLLVTGASGHLGRRVVSLLLERGGADRIIAGTRTISSIDDLVAAGAEARAVDFDDPDGMAAAFAGVDRALIVSTDAVGEPGARSVQHLRAVDAAVGAGVKHLVYTSFSNPAADSVVSIAEDHRRTEAALRERAPGHTALRNNLYADLLLQSLPQAVAHGQLLTGRGDGAIAYVTRADCARAAAAALAADFDGHRAVEITGPEAVTGAQLAALASEVSGRPVVHAPVPPEQFAAIMSDAGLPDGLVHMLTSFERAAGDGELAPVGDGVQRLTGTAPTSVADFLRANADAVRGAQD